MCVCVCVCVHVLCGQTNVCYHSCCLCTVGVGAVAVFFLAQGELAGSFSPTKHTASIPELSKIHTTGNNTTPLQYVAMVRKTHSAPNNGRCQLKHRPPRGLSACSAHSAAKFTLRSEIQATDGKGSGLSVGEITLALPRHLFPACRLLPALPLQCDRSSAVGPLPEWLPFSFMLSRRRNLSPTFFSLLTRSLTNARDGKMFSPFPGRTAVGTATLRRGAGVAPQPILRAVH